MFVLLNIAACAVSFKLVHEDFKAREVSLHLLILLGVLNFFIPIANNIPINEIVTNFAFILIYLIAIIVFLKLYFVIRTHNISQGIVNQKIGLGDLIYFLSMAWLMKLEGFVFFMVAGMIMSLAFVFFFRKGIQLSKFQIPLIGVMSIVAIAMYIVNIIVNKNVLWYRIDTYFKI